MATNIGKQEVNIGFSPKKYPWQQIIIILHTKGKKDSWLYALGNQLKHLEKYSNLNNPEEIETYIANKTLKNGQKASDNYKSKLCEAYAIYCSFNDIDWKKPIYTQDEKQPKLPSERKIIKLLSAAGKTLHLKLWISTKTGFRPIEVINLKVKDLDIEHNALIATTAKHGAARTIPIPKELTQALQTYIIQNNRKLNDKIFNGTSRSYQNNFRELKLRIAERDHDPSIMDVRLYDLRHYYGTMQYIKHRDIILTAEDMGHKDFNTTRRYIHLAKLLEVMADEGYIVKTAKTQQEIIELLEAGFTLQDTTPDGTHYYRKKR